jgi:hypothetical protein
MNELIRQWRHVPQAARRQENRGGILSRDRSLEPVGIHRSPGSDGRLVCQS